jgi:hypothetical protein
VSVPARLRFQVLERDEFTCQYCGAKAPDAVIQVDHIVPVANGGQDVADNLVAACLPCNYGKSDSDLRFIPDHILDRAGTAYERGAAIRAAIAGSLPESQRAAEPHDAPEAIVHAVTSAGDALKVSMAAARLSQSFVAGALGVDKSYVCQLASGKKAIPKKLVDPLCAITGSNLLRQFFERHLDDDVQRLADALRECAR